MRAPRLVPVGPGSALVSGLALGLVLSNAAAQEREPAAPAPDLPRVLLIGDSISIGYTAPVRKLMQGRAVVQRNKGNAGPSSRGVASIDEWLQGGPFDVIHFNFGLHDLAYRDANGRGLDKKSGKQWASPEVYGENLKKIVARLQQTKADLIFATTTPVPEGEPGRVVGDAVKFNAVAVGIMREQGIAIDDLYGTVAGRMAELATKPGNVHFTKEGSMVLARQVVRTLDRALRQRDAGKQRLHAGAKHPKFAPTRQVVYKTVGEVKLALHVFEPDLHRATDRRAAIVFFFGGGWNGGSPSQFYPHCDYLAGRGMVAIAAEYRVKSRHQTTPFECVEDGKSALRYVRSHARELGIDPGRIAAGGGSAGGHVAAAVATVEGFEALGESVQATPDALVLFNPVYDNGPGGWGHDRVKDRWREISPAHNIRKGMPPAITFLGTEDRLIPVATAKKFLADMRKVGSQSDLLLYEGRGHGFFNHGRGDGRDYKHSVLGMDRFLAGLGFLKGLPTLRLD